MLMIADGVSRNAYTTYSELKFYNYFTIHILSLFKETEYAKKFLACRNTCSSDAMNALVKKGGMTGDDAQNIESW